ncbi:MAG: prepilin-type N-terminal cleavage/methylation domain-containing protein [Phycisphaerae bacterium]|nr:prepilin-type N-terminal cleavage/methylation domain-containing protein [Phycisphaerae bacterium]
MMAGVHRVGHRASRFGGDGREGFTLIELLVVIAIIALVAAILLPSLASARRAAQTAVCSANQRSIGQGVAQYANDSNDWIIGSPAGSGGHITSAFAGGATTQVWDFMGPLMKTWGIPLPEDATPTAVIQRFNLIREAKQFRCPSNDFLADHFGGPNAGTGPMISYNTSRYMLFEHVATSTPLIGISQYNNIHEEQIPTGWSPRITRMGDSSRKVFCADGSRFSTVSVTPDYDLSGQASWGGAFSDASPYTTFTRSWDRAGMTGSGFDARVYAFRHGIGQVRPKAPANAFRMNLLFFDGHVQALGDLDSANPVYWLPAGSRLSTSAMFPDVPQYFGLSGTININ